MTREISIFDTTLRDGEQSPGCSLMLAEKIEVAAQLEALKVDVIEAGFAAASRGDFEAVKAVAGRARECVVASLARALPRDIAAAAEALVGARRPRIHTFIATSDIHLTHKLKKSRAEVLEIAEAAVRLARRRCEDVEFSAEDATRSDPEFLIQVLSAAVRAGATVINIPDTVGFIMPSEFGALVRRVLEQVPGIDRTTLSVHCHDDLGMAVANTLAAVRAGAAQLECTVNGIGERAGNAALEEVVMALQTRRPFFDRNCRIDTSQIYRTSKLVSTLIGRPIPANKAVVGANAFAHEAGIHQHGVLAETSTYEIMTPQSIGLMENSLVLGKHSGRHAFEAQARKMGYALDDRDLDQAFARFKDLADRKKTVTLLDIEAILGNVQADAPSIYKLERFIINSGNTITATANIKMSSNGRIAEEAAAGDGPMDASFKAIEKVIGVRFDLDDYTVHSIGGGKDAQGEVMVKIRRGRQSAIGRGLSTDVVEAGILAYINAANRIIADQSIPGET